VVGFEIAPTFDSYLPIVLSLLAFGQLACT
jgi:hypothetical protein